MDRSLIHNTIRFSFLVVSLAGIMVFPAVVSGQPYVVSGRISDRATKVPVQATLIFQSSPDVSDVYIENSNGSNGQYTVQLHRIVKYVVEIKADHYKPVLDTLRLTGNTDSLNYELLSIRKGQILRLQKIYFDQGSYNILDSSYHELTELLLLMDQYPEMVIRLEGHTDRLGGRQNNIVLSQSRVNEIKKYLTSKGINAKRIDTRAFGGTRPISTENTPESRQLNRRVEVRILKM